MIISIAGMAGAGKTTAAKLLAGKLGFPFYDMGMIRRKMALQHQMTLADYNTYGETHPETDTEVDEYQKKLGVEHDNFVIQGRISFHFIPHSFKVYLTVNEEEGARRVWEDMQYNPGRHNESRAKTLREVRGALRRRQTSDTRRYSKYYGGLNAHDLSQFDLVIDTTHSTPEKTVAMILKKIKKLHNTHKK